MKHLKPDFRWSFSKLASFRQCPMSFYLTYIQEAHEDELPNFWGLYGSFCHKLLEDWALNKTPAFCLAQEYKAGYDDAVTMPPPSYLKGYGEKSYNAGLQYFESFDGFGDEWDVVSAEKKFVLDIAGYKVSGIADLVLKHRQTGELWVVDHKTKSSSSLRKELDIYRKQLYLYALWCKNEFGVFPARISFNLLKENKWIHEDFSERELEKTKQWFVDTIHEIEACDIFEDWTTCVKETDQKSNFFCSQLCDVASICDAYQVVRGREIEAWKAKRQAEEDALIYGYS